LQRFRPPVLSLAFTPGRSGPSTPDPVELSGDERFLPRFGGEETSTQLPSTPSAVRMSGRALRLHLRFSPPLKAWNSTVCRTTGSWAIVLRLSLNGGIMKSMVQNHSGIGHMSTPRLSPLLHRRAPCPLSVRHMPRRSVRRRPSYRRTILPKNRWARQPAHPPTVLRRVLSYGGVATKHLTKQY